MRLTLLDMTQQILSSMDSDEVNSISDTIESLQVAKLIEQVYYDLSVELALPEHETTFQLNASGDNNLPTKMTLPNNATKLFSVRYNYQEDADTTPDYQPIIYMPFGQFVEYTQSYRENTDIITTMNIVFNNETFKIIARKDKDPQYYTSVDDFTLIFDSFDEDKDTTLKKTKTMCEGMTYSPFTQADTFVPDLDSTQFPLLVNKAKVRAFNELKQQVNQEAVAEARRQKIMSQNNKVRGESVPEVYKHARWGRTSVGSSKAPNIGFGRK